MNPITTMIMLKNESIDYSLLGKSREYYYAAGFESIEVPWIVPVEISRITSPGEHNEFKSDGGVLVASAEQSFLQLLNDNKLHINTRYQAITPCFRKEPEDELHSQCFMKLELFNYYNMVDKTDIFERFIINELNETVNIALKFFKDQMSYFSRKNLEIITTGNLSYDINYDGVEIGSYGIRSNINYMWVYGTGLALPRFSYVVKK